MILSSKVAVCCTAIKCSVSATPGQREPGAELGEMSLRIQYRSQKGAFKYIQSYLELVIKKSKTSSILVSKQLHEFHVYRSAAVLGLSKKLK